MGESEVVEGRGFEVEPPRVEAVMLSWSATRRVAAVSTEGVGLLWLLALVLQVGVRRADGRGRRRGEGRVGESRNAGIVGV